MAIGIKTTHKAERVVRCIRCDFSMKARQNMMEQKKSNSSNKEDAYLGVAIHSQVRKIKQEMEKIKHPSLEQSEIIRPVYREIIRQQQRSRSPLGIAQRPISFQLATPRGFRSGICSGSYQE